MRLVHTSSDAISKILNWGGFRRYRNFSPICPAAMRGKSENKKEEPRLHCRGFKKASISLHRIRSGFRPFPGGHPRASPSHHRFEVALHVVHADVQRSDEVEVPGAPRQHPAPLFRRFVRMESRLPICCVGDLTADTAATAHLGHCTDHRNLLRSPSYNQKPATRLALMKGVPRPKGPGNALMDLPLTASFAFFDKRARSVG